MTPEKFGKAATLCAPESVSKQAIARLDRHFGTSTVMVEDVTMLPAEIQSEMARFNYRNDGAKGVYDTRDNRVYLVASRLESDHDVIMAYRHEVTGHMGVRASLGTDRDSVFQQVYASYSSDPRLEEIAERYKLDLDYEINQLLAAEELVALLAEPGEKPSLYDQIRLSAKEEYSRQTGEEIAYTDDDIRALLERGRDYLRETAAYRPEANLNRRSPEELPPRLSTLNHLIKAQSPSQWADFDAYIVSASDSQTGGILAHYESAEALAESFSRYLSESGVTVDQGGNVRIHELTEKTASLIAPNTDVIVGMESRPLRTLMDNLRPGRPPEVIDEALANSIEVDSPFRFMYVGEQAAEKLGRTESFEQATQLKMAGKTSGEIWMATGWFEGPDGAWRFEISDQDATANLQAMEEIAWLQGQLSSVDRQRLDGIIESPEAARKTDFYMERIDRVNSAFDEAEPGTLPAYLSHPTLFEAYPELTKMRVIIDPDAPYPVVTTNSPRIVIPSSYLEDSDLLLDTLVHETQHLVQRIEGFAKGLSPFMNGYRESWENELNELLESDPDVQIYMELHAELFDGSTHVNPELTKREMEVLEEDSPSIQRMNELSERLRLVGDPEAYTKAFGEIEANESAARMAMTEGQRRKIAPYGTNPTPGEFVVHQFDDIPQAMFLGVKANTANAGRLSLAHEMETKGAGRDQILASTGWFKGVDEMWRFEVDDYSTSLNTDALSILKPAWNTLESPRIAKIVHRPNPNGGFDLTMYPENATRLSDIVELKGVSRSYLMMNLPPEVASSVMLGKGDLEWFDFDTDEPDGRHLDTDFVYDAYNYLPLNRLVDHQALMEAYPELAEWKVAFHPKSDQWPNSSAFCDSLNRTIVLFPQTQKQVIPTLLHEIQHAIQTIEGFAPGASPNDPSVAAKIEAPQQQYHSELLKVIDSAPFDKASSDQWLGFLKKQPGVKQAEMGAAGILDFLGGQDAGITRGTLRGVVESNAVSIEEIIASTSYRSAEKLKDLQAWCRDFIEEAHESGIHYAKAQSEIRAARGTGLMFEEGKLTPEQFPDLVNMMKRTEGFSFEDLVGRINEINEITKQELEPGGSTLYENYALIGEDYRELVMIARGGVFDSGTGNPFVTDHWENLQNVLAHVRFQTVEDEAGRRTLLIEEIQSDWRNASLKLDQATASTGSIEDLEKEIARLQGELTQTADRMEQNAVEIRELGYNEAVLNYHEGSLSLFDLSDEAFEMVERYNYLVGDSFSLAPDKDGLKRELSEAEYLLEKARALAEDAEHKFPLGKDWYATVAKRMVRYAAENGFDAMAWSPAAVQAERYSPNQAKRFDEVEWHRIGEDEIHVSAEVQSEPAIDKSYTPKEILELFDRKTAAKILAEPEGSVADANITIDSKGFETFYDQMLPKAVNKCLKGYGVSVEHNGLSDAVSAPAGVRFPMVTITDEMRSDLTGQTTPMYSAHVTDAMSAYYRSAGEVEARAVEMTYRKPDLKSLHPLDRYDVAPSDQIVHSPIASVAMKIGPHANGVNMASLETAAKIVSQRALGLEEAYPKVLNSLSGNDFSETGGALRQRFARLADQVNAEIKAQTGWALDDTGHLRFELDIPDCRATQSISEYIAQDVEKFANDVRSGVVDVTQTTEIYNRITQQAVPLKSLVGDHQVMDAYPELEDVKVQQSPEPYQTRFQSQTGTIIVSPNIGRMELGAYLTKGINEAINAFERIGDPEIQRAFYPKPDIELNRARALQSVIAQSEGLASVSGEAIEGNLKWLHRTDPAVLKGMPLERAAIFAHAAQVNIKGEWSQYASPTSFEALPKVANEGPSIEENKSEPERSSGRLAM